MSSNLPPVPHRIPLIDQGGFLSQPWADWFQKAYLRMGGTVAETNDELYTITADRIPALSIDSSKLASTVAGDGLAGGAGTALSVNVDGSTIETSSDTLRVKDLGVTPAKLSGSIPFAKLLSTDWTSSTGSNGYQKFPNGFYIQWGVTASIPSGTNTSVSFPTAFPTSCLRVIPGIQGNSATATSTTGQFGADLVSASAFTLNNRTSNAYVFNYIAVGY